MKKVCFPAALMLLFIGASAQTTKPVQRQSAGRYSALADTAYKPGTFRITDPTLLAMDYGVPRTPEERTLLGVPKGAFGYKNGQFLFRSSGGVSSGSSGSVPSVGTGITLFGAGAGSMVPGANGKSLFSGNPMWGASGSGSRILVADSVLRNDLPPRRRN